MTQMTVGTSEAKFSWARAAFIDAHGRFQASLRNYEEQAVWTNLGETLFWISALNDTYAGLVEAKAENAAKASTVHLSVPTSKKEERKGIRRARKLGLQKYQNHRNRDPYGKAVAGLIIPRNSVVHALANVVIERSDEADHFWQPTFVAVTEMKLDHPQNKASKAILEASASRPIRYQLRDANYFFIRRQAHLDMYIDGLPG